MVEDEILHQLRTKVDSCFKPENSAESFYKRLEDSGIPIIAILGASRSGKSTLIQTFTGGEHTEVADRLAKAANDFGTVAKHDEYDGLEGSMFVEFSEKKRAIITSTEEDAETTLYNWPTKNGALAYIAYNHYPKLINDPAIMEVIRSGKVERIYADGNKRLVNIAKTTYHLIAHYVCIDGLDFLLLDLPGELFLRGEESWSRAALATERQLPSLLSGAIIVESFATLYSAEGDNLGFRRTKNEHTRKEDEQTLGIGEFEDMVQGVPGGRGEKLATDVVRWVNLLKASQRRHGPRPPLPVLHAITKFDPLTWPWSFKPVLAKEDPSLKKTVLDWENALGKVSLAQSVRELDQAMQNLLNISEEMIHRLRGGGERFWYRLLRDVRSESFPYDAAPLRVVPIQCHYLGSWSDDTCGPPVPIMKKCGHGSGLVRWWIRERVAAAYRAGF